MPRMPVVFLPHGGGPVTHVELGRPRAEAEALAAYWRSIRDLYSSKPEAIIAVSAHWEQRVPTVMSSPNPPMFYDYSGFPAAAYEIQWPAPGHPTLAARVRTLLSEAGIASADDARRGFDHGTFTPLKQAFPEADIPVVQLSLKEGLDAAEHIAIGRALAPLRDAGILIIGSGDTFHNFRHFNPSGHDISVTFNAWLDETITGPATDRDAKLTSWTSAPSARLSHPREEHLIPLMVAAGAAGPDEGKITWTGTFLGTQQTGYHFG